MPCRVCAENTLAELPLATVRIKVRAGKGRIEEVEYFPPQITCGGWPWPHQREKKTGFRSGEGEERERRKSERGRGGTERRKSSTEILLSLVCNLKVAK